jgi:hypothetical protein
MDALVAYDSSSESERSESGAADDLTKVSCDTAAGVQCIVPPATILPSVLELLDSTAAGVLPDFLVQHNKPVIDYRKAPIVAAPAVDVSAEAASATSVAGEKRGREENSHAPEVTSGAIPERSTRGGRMPTVVRPPNPSSTRGGDRASARGRGAAAAAGGKNAGSGVDIKERVKHQRLSGQSGIGADFRTWRSEEEMRLRQSIDS